MKKVKRLLAIIGAAALLALYISTIVLAIIGSEQAMNLLKAAIYSTVVLPVLIWTYSFIYKLLKDHYSSKDGDKDASGNETKQNKSNSR